MNKRIRKLIDEARAIAWATPVDSPSALARLLAVAQRRKRQSAPLEPWEEAPEPLQRARMLLEQYEVELRQIDEHSIARSLGFRSEPDRSAYAHAIVELIEEAERRGRFQLAVEIHQNGLPPECSCRCREHQIHGCALCLRIEHCAAHADGNPARLSPRWRREHADRGETIVHATDDGDPALVHVLRFGAVLCGFSQRTPSDWPDHHRWVPIEDAEARANCAGCLVALDVEPSRHGELRQLPITTRTIRDRDRGRGGER